MEILIGIIVIGFIGLVCLFTRSYFERKKIEVCHYEIKSDKVNKKVKIVMLADLHSKDYGNDNEMLMNLITMEEPDMILIAGDMFVGSRKDDCLVAISIIKKLEKLAPVYYGLGNHEERVKDYIDEFGESKYHWYMKQLQGLDVTILDNQITQVVLKGQKLRITGLTAPREYFEKFNHTIMPVEVIGGLVGDAKEDVYQILIAHNPVHLESYIRWGADLTVSGHLHGGIIRLPILGGIITPQVKVLPRFSAGKYELDGKVGIISRGLGEHTVNLRFGNLPELSVITLSRND